MAETTQTLTPAAANPGDLSKEAPKSESKAPGASVDRSRPPSPPPSELRAGPETAGVVGRRNTKPRGRQQKTVAVEPISYESDDKLHRYGLSEGLLRTYANPHEKAFTLAVGDVAVTRDETGKPSHNVQFVGALKIPTPRGAFRVEVLVLDSPADTKVTAVKPQLLREKLDSATGVAGAGPVTESSFPALTKERAHELARFWIVKRLKTVSSHSVVSTALCSGFK